MPEQQRVKNYLKLHQVVISIIQVLIDVGDPQKQDSNYDVNAFNSQVLTWMSRICLDNGSWPQGYLTKFEISRMNIKSTGT